MEPMRRLLSIESSPHLREILIQALPVQGFSITHISSLTEASLVLQSDGAFSLVVLAAKLPDGDGLSLLRAWLDSGKFRDIPVMMISETEDVDAKVSAFELGVEDYLPASIHPRELRARIELRLRRAEQLRSTAEVLRRGCLRLNFPLMRATVIEDAREVPVEFTAKEFRLVATMAAHEGQVFTRAQLVKEIWGDQMHVVNRTVDSHICGARRKLGPAGDYIQSVTGAGYRFLVKD
jgi:two-component system phosphate regulon response regulator PhoB